MIRIRIFGRRWGLGGELELENGAIVVKLGGGDLIFGRVLPDFDAFEPTLVGGN